MHIQWKWTVPNVLSLLRIAILPAFIILYLFSREYQSDAMQYTAFALLIVSGLTDCLDGFIARRFNQASEIGKLRDPIADKLTQVAVLLLVGQGGGQLIGRDVAQLDQQIAQSDVLHGCTPPLSQRITFRETVYTEPSSDVPSGLA